MKKFHCYVLKKDFAKKSHHIEMIIPIEDREVPESMFKQYQDTQHDSN